MITFSMELAEVIVKANVIYESTRDFCREYLVGESYDDMTTGNNEAVVNQDDNKVVVHHENIEVSVCQEDIDRERLKSARERQLEGLEAVDFMDSYLETLALYRKIAEKMVDYNVILFHGAVVRVDDAAYLFTAKSGTGKTTHINLWKEHFKERLTIVNGDKPLLRFTENGIVAFGTPWMGKENYGCNTKADLRALCVIERGTVNSIRRIELSEAVGMLLQQVYRNNDALYMSKVMNIISAMGDGRVGLYILKCNMDMEACITAYNGMQQ